MKLSHIEHIGIAVNSLKTAIPYYEEMLGLKCYAIEEVADQKVKTAFFRIGQTKIELLESTDPEGPIGKFLEKKGEGMHHLCMEVDDIDQKLAELKEKGVRLINETAEVLPGRKMAFIHPKAGNGVLIELYQLTD